MERRGVVNKDQYPTKVRYTQINFIDMSQHLKKLFVYGTLLKGERNSRYLLGFDLLKAFSVPGRLYNTEFGYPAAVFDNNSQQRIYGELYSIPGNSTDILEKLDRFEGTEEKLFERKKIIYDGQEFFIYEAGEKLKSQLEVKNIIGNGRWLTYSGLAIEYPVQFARNFELIHREYYRKEPDEESEDTIFLKGSRKILLTCPHSTVHYRKGKRKIMELYTAAIAAVLHSQTDCCCLYSNKIQDSDPNYYQDSKFREKVQKVVQEENIDFVLDIHGTGSRRKFDVYPGIGKEMEFLNGNEHILENLFSVAKSHDISVGSLDTFPAVRQMTVTKFAARELKIPSMQIEINRRIRLPDADDKFLNLVGFLNGFLKGI